MRRTLPIWLALPVLLAAGLAACSPAAGPTSQPVPTAAAPTAAPQALTQPSQIMGVWQIFSPHCTPGYMIIRPDGTYTWSCNRDGSDGLSGTYRFSGSDFMILNDLCGAEGRYQVYSTAGAPAGKGLTFKLVKDDCAADVNALTAQPATWDSALP